jgi:hypothetical protein
LWQVGVGLGGDCHVFRCALHCHVTRGYPRGLACLRRDVSRKAGGTQDTAVPRKLVSFGSLEEEQAEALRQLAVELRDRLRFA